MTGEQVGIIGFLVWNSFVDMRKKKIAAASIPVFVFLWVLWSLLLMGRDMDAAQTLALESLVGLIPGAVLCSVSVFSRGAVGLGDGIVTAVVGLYIGAASAAEMVLWAFFLAFFWCVSLLFLKKYKRQSQIPFVPFLLLGLLISICL